MTTSRLYEMAVVFDTLSIVMIWLILLAYFWAGSRRR